MSTTPGCRRLSRFPRRRGWLPLARLHHFAFEYDSGSTEDDMVAFYTGGDRYVTSPTPFDPTELLKELHNGKSVAALIAWSPPSE